MKKIKKTISIHSDDSIVNNVPPSLHSLPHNRDEYQLRKKQVSNFSDSANSAGTINEGEESAGTIN